MNQFQLVTTISILGSKAIDANLEGRLNDGLKVILAQIDVTSKLYG